MDIRQSYEKINISEQAKNQIKNDILAGEKQKAKYAICTKPDGELEKNVWENSKNCELFLK